MKQILLDRHIAISFSILISVSWEEISAVHLCIAVSLQPSLMYNLQLVSSLDTKHAKKVSPVNQPLEDDSD